jgi:NitT/TauT family transport system ATP-binding protein
MDAAIAFRDVALRLGGQTIYESMSFDVAPGEFVCLLGPSGCGKSTALRLIGGLIPALSGQVLVEGRPAAEGWDRLAYVFQSPRLLPWKTALDNAAYGLELRRPTMGREERRRRAAEQLARVGLGADGGKMPAVLSGGERQRVAIARALAIDPDIVLMDEPFSALDPDTRTRLRRQLLELWQGSGKTVVFVTHDVDEALVLADRILLFSAKPGRVARTIRVDAPRPRELAADPSLVALREELIALFRGMGDRTFQEDRA